MRGYTVMMLSCAALGAAGSALSAPLHPFEASYAVIWHGFTAGVSSFTLRQESEREWTYVSRNSPRGLFRLVPKAAFTLTSRMSVTPGGVRPLLFTATDPDDGTVKGEVRFDWDGNRATGVVKGAKIGYVTDYLNRPLQDVTAPEGGTVMFIRALPSLKKGDTMANIGVAKP